MAGLYIHVPFCAKRCLYCDFYSNTDMSYKAPYLEALLEELALRRPYLEGEPVETIYFGGGTPSQLSSGDFERIFEAIYRLYTVSPDAEITVEANPDDVDDAFARMLRRLPFNRVSMGVQSFDAEDLRFLNRRHSREQAIRAVGLCRDAYIYNVSIDLIYGLPGQTEAKWEANVREALRLDIPHLSAYHLIYEEGTALYKLWEAGKVKAVDEETSVSLFSLLINRMREAGYLHYEISNFAREGYLSRHNSAYWTGKEIPRRRSLCPFLQRTGTGVERSFLAALDSGHPHGAARHRAGRTFARYPIQRLCHHRSAHDVGHPTGRNRAAFRCGTEAVLCGNGRATPPPGRVAAGGREALLFRGRSLRFRRSDERPPFRLKVPKLDFHQQNRGLSVLFLHTSHIFVSIIVADKKVLLIFAPKKERNRAIHVYNCGL